MMQSMHYSLTEYRDIRLLEFEYVKQKEEALNLKAQITALENMCRKQINDHKQSRSELEKCKNKLRETLNIEKDEKISAIELLQIFLVRSQQNYDAQIQKYEEEKQNQNSQYEQELAYLQGEIDRHGKENRNLRRQSEKMQRECVQLQLRVAAADNTEDGSQDTGFALELLTFQKELLELLFHKLISLLRPSHAKELLQNVTKGYSKAVETYRQKLQIQYDLTDLEKEYKLEKSNGVAEDLLIQLRKQIQQFRAELHKHKTLLYHAENSVHSTLNALAVEQQTEAKSRSYSLEIEEEKGKLEKQNSRINASYVYKHTGNTQNLMEEVLKQDRLNMERIFKETRKIEK